MIITNKFSDKILYKLGKSGIMLFPFIFIRTDKCTPRIINHENIHYEQAKELLVIFFYIWYLFSFIYQWFKYWDYPLAYRNIIFEREAYKEDENYTYLIARKKFNFLRY